MIRIFFIFSFFLHYHDLFSDSELIKKKDYYLIKNIRSCADILEATDQDVVENLYTELKRKSFLELFSFLGTMPKQISDSAIDSCITSFSLINEEISNNLHCMTLDVIFDKKRIESIRNQKLRSLDRAIYGIERISISIDSYDIEKISLFLVLLDELKIKYRLEFVDNLLIELRLINVNANNFILYLQDNDFSPSIQSDGFYLI